MDFQAHLNKSGLVRTKKRGLWPLFSSLATELLVVDVHGNFKTETDVAVFRCLPVHSISPLVNRFG